MRLQFGRNGGNGAGVATPPTSLQMSSQHTPSSRLQGCVWLHLLGFYTHVRYGCDLHVRGSHVTLRGLCVSPLFVLQQFDVSDSFSSFLRMSVFDRLTSLIPQVSSASRQTKERSPPRPAPPLSLSSPVVRRRPIQIPSFLDSRRACDNPGEISSR